MAESVLVFIFKLIYLTESGDDDGWGSGTSAAGAHKSGGGGGGGGKGCFKCGEDGMCPWSAASVERMATWPGSVPPQEVATTNAGTVVRLVLNELCLEPSEIMFSGGPHGFRLSRAGSL